MILATHAIDASELVSRTLSRFVAWIACATALAVSPAVWSQMQQTSTQNLRSPDVIIVGFLGGFVGRNNDRHLEVQLIERFSKDGPAVHAMVFENRHTTAAHKELVRLLDVNGDGQLSEAEKQAPRIILLGHSWGGSAVIRLANELNENGIPVVMTIQLDSINKGAGDDCVIPPNVAQALNFYQTRGLVHGCQALRPEDASRTHILGNYRIEYTAQPAGCSSYSWLDRHFFKTHNAMDCDARVWALVEDKIRAQIHDAVRDRDASRPAE